MTSLDFYCGFDEQFFSQKRRSENSSAYRAFLEQHREILNKALTDPTFRVENTSFYAQLERLQGELVHSTILKKPWDGLTVTIEDLLAKAERSLTSDQCRYIDGRVHFHLARLMLPEEYSKEMKRYYKIMASPQNTVCEKFGNDFINYAAETPAEVRKEFGVKTPADKFRVVTGSEGLYVFIFWTLAPYIHLNLIERGLSQNESMIRIVSWVMESYDQHPESFNQLQHTEPVWDYFFHGSSHLGYDERMPSHLKARLLAREMAQELVK